MNPSGPPRRPHSVFFVARMFAFYETLFESFLCIFGSLECRARTPDPAWRAALGGLAQNGQKRRCFFVCPALLPFLLPQGPADSAWSAVQICNTEKVVRHGEGCQEVPARSKWRRRWSGKGPCVRVSLAEGSQDSAATATSATGRER